MQIKGSVLALVVVASADGSDKPPEQKNPEVSESKHDTSPPLRDIPPAKRLPGQRVHPVRPIPRPRPDAGPKKKTE